MTHPADLRRALDIAWKSRNHRTTRSTAAKANVSTCEQCGEPLPEQCFWADIRMVTQARTKRVWFCSEECMHAGQVKEGFGA